MRWDGRGFPIFLAGLCFTVAYAYGIIRYRLLLVDQIVSKGVMYYLASSGLTAAFALTLALGPVARQYLNIFPLTQQSALISIVLMLAVILLLWLRDVFQGMIDRRFYREKYQLGKALERMNRAVGHLADPEAVAELMLGSCRDVLGRRSGRAFICAPPRNLPSASSRLMAPKVCRASSPRSTP